VTTDSTVIHLAGIPPDFDTFQLMQIFSEIDIELLGIRFEPPKETASPSLFAFIEIDSKEVERFMDKILRYSFGGTKIRCCVSREESFFASTSCS